MIKYIAFADFETGKYYKNDRILGKVRSWVYRWGLEVNIINQKIVEIVKNENKFEYYLDNDEDVIDQFLESIFNTAPVSDYLYCYFHNFRGYDGHYFPYMLNRLGFKQTNRINKKYHNKNFSIISVNNKFIEIEIIYKNKIISFRDTLSIFTGSSIKQMGEFLNKPKLEMDDYDKPIKDMTKEELEHWINYNIRDVEVLEDFYEYQMKTLNMDLTHKLTTAGIAMWNLDNFYQNKKIKNKYTLRDVSYMKSYDLWEEFNKSYLGGLTTYNPKYVNQVVEEVDYFDINSSYPYTMTKNLPIKYIGIKQRNKNDVVMYKLSITKLKLKKEFNTPIWIDKDYTNKFITELNEQRIYYQWKEYFDWMQKFYDIEYVIIKEYWFETDPFLKDIINKSYENRLDYKRLEKENKNNQEKKNYYNTMQFNEKIILNSTYGKYGQNAKQTNLFYLSKDLIKDFNKDYWVLIKSKPKGFHKLKQDKQNEFYTLQEYYLIPKNEYNNFIKQNELFFYYERYEIETEHEHDEYSYKVSIIPLDIDRNQIRNVAIASYITSQSRIRIIEQIHELRDDFVYTDTDSIICKKNTFKSQLSNKLGDWKKEGEFKYCFVIKNKSYILSNTKILNDETKYTLSGVNKYNDLYNKDIYTLNQTGIVLERLSSKSTPTGKILEPKQIIVLQGDNNEIKVL